MLTPVVQRWRDRCGVYRPAGETIVTSHYEVAAIPDDRTARGFVEQHHYSASYPNARFRFGLYWGGLIVGVAVFSHPVNDIVLAVFGDRREGVELGRLVLLDLVPANAESFFIARCFELLRRAGIRGVVSFSDPVRRTTADGWGARPHPMPFHRTPELLGYARWVIGAYDKGIPWQEWVRARMQPGNLGDRSGAQQHLPVLGGEQ